MDVSGVWGVSMTEIKVFPDGQQLAHATAELFVECADAAIKQQGRFSVALSGGSTPRALHRILAGEGFVDRVDWSNVYVFFGDERTVPPDDPESNFRMAQETLLSQVPIPQSNVYRIPAEQQPAQAANSYEQMLRDFFGDQPRFDLVFLGMGDDGHTASLFPHTAALDEQARWVVANHVEKLDTWRITLTAGAINAAKKVAFLVSGEKKATRLREVLHSVHQPHELPSQLIQPESGALLWLVDAPAAVLL
jgi:6-phosphogluconolactonase